MKTTFELPDTLFQKAKLAATYQGLSLRQLFTDAIADKFLAMDKQSNSKPWMKDFGLFSKNRKQRLETRKVQSIIDDEFSKIDYATWK